MTPEELQRNAISIMSLAIKATPAGARADPNQVMFELSANWESVSRDPSEFRLQPLYNALRSRGCSPQESAMVCLLVQRREDRLGTRIILPDEVLAMSPQERVDLLATVPKTGGTGLTVVPASAVKPGAPAPAPATVRPAAPQAPPPGKVGPVRLNPKQQARKWPVSPGTVVICALLLGATVAIKIAGRERGLEPLDIPLPPPLTKLSAFTMEENLFFYDPKTDFALPRPELQAMGVKMSEIAATRGAKRAYMCLKSDMKRCRNVKAIVREARTTFLEDRKSGAPPPTAPTP